mmetsp:Transcript_17681/g.45215  ORF Transcript_17681/g.45215 Transcript_17681/m.45215 type:complete len:155 (-) Transcript_17681:211-675(-)
MCSKMMGHSPILISIKARFFTVSLGVQECEPLSNIAISQTLSYNNYDSHVSAPPFSSQPDPPPQYMNSSQVLTASNLDPTMLGAVTKKLDDVLDGKNSALKSLQYELDRVTKAHNDVIRVYESKLTEFGIPLEELGFRPLITNTSTGPAGLVAS